MEKPGYSLNKWPIDQRMIITIVGNMDLNTFPNLSKQPAIVPTSTHLHGLPTETNSFSDISSNGSGYPLIAGSGLI